MTAEGTARTAHNGDSGDNGEHRDKLRATLAAFRLLLAEQHDGLAERRH